MICLSSGTLPWWVHYDYLEIRQSLWWVIPMVGALWLLGDQGGPYVECIMTACRSGFCYGGCYDCFSSYGVCIIDQWALLFFSSYAVYGDSSMRSELWLEDHETLWWVPYDYVEIRLLYGAHSWVYAAHAAHCAYGSIIINSWPFVHVHAIACNE
jgi:hypothetical protein